MGLVMTLSLHDVKTSRKISFKGCTLAIRLFVDMLLTGEGSQVSDLRSLNETSGMLQINKTLD